MHYIKHTRTPIILLCLLPFLGLAQVQPLPDGKGEEPNSHIAFLKNDGQFSDEDDNSVPDVKYGFIQGNLQGYASVDGRFSFVSIEFDTIPNDTITTDSIFRQDMTLVNNVEGNITPVAADPVGEEEAEGVYNFYLPVCPNGVTDVKSYKRLVYEDVYTDIDYHVYSNASGFKFYFVIEPGADPDDIRMLFEGQDLQQVSSTQVDLFMGSLQVALENALAYQLNAQNQVVPISSWTPGYLENQDGTVSLTTGSYNTSQTLVIQIGHPLLPAAPQPGGNANHLEWSSFVTGGSSDEAYQVFNDELGYSYYAGKTNTIKFPLLQGRSVYKGGFDAYAVKFNPNGVKSFGTYFGNLGDEVFTCGVATPTGNSYWAGTTTSNYIYGQNLYFNPGGTTGMVLGLNATGQAIGIPHFYGGESDDYIRAIAYNGSNRICVVGNTSSSTNGTSTSFPTTTINSSSYTQSNFGGGVADGFIGEFNTTMSATPYPVVYSTRFGGDKFDYFTAVSYDGNGDIVVGGVTQSQNSTNTCTAPATGNMPICNPSGTLFSSTFRGGLDDYFVLSLGANRELTWSSYLGSTENDGVKLALVADKNNNRIYMAGSTTWHATFHNASSSSGFSWSPGSTISSGTNQLQVLQLDNKSTISWSSFIGCDFNESTSPALALSNNFLYLTFNTECQTAQSAANYCNPPAANSNELVICDNSGDLWLQENGSGVVFKGTSQSVIAAFDMQHNLKWCTPYGGSDVHYNQSISYDVKKDRVYVGGATLSKNDIPLRRLPDLNSHFQRNNAGSSVAGYIARFAANLTSIQIKEVVAKNWNLKAYPNPASSLLHIDLEGKANYQLMDISGRKLQSGKISPEQNAIIVSSLSVGTYVLRLQQGDKVATFKFVKE
mgnify:CR=1 FL=1